MESLTESDRATLRDIYTRVKRTLDKDVILLIDELFKGPLTAQQLTDIVAHLAPNVEKDEDAFNIAVIKSKLLDSVTQSAPHATHAPQAPRAEELAPIDPKITIPYFSALGIPYRVRDVKGDGKCFFHAICYALNVDMNLFFMQLYNSLMTEDLDVYRDDVKTGMRMLMIKAKKLDHGQVPTQQEIDDFWGHWLSSGEFVDVETKYHTAEILLERGIGLAIVHVTGSPYGVFDRIDELTYMEVINNTVIIPAMLEAFERKPKNVVRLFPKMTHLLVAAVNNGLHYRITEFHCGEGRWTVLPCKANMGRLHRPLLDALHTKELHDARFGVIWDTCENDDDMCVRPPRNLRDIGGVYTRTWR